MTSYVFTIFPVNWISSRTEVSCNEGERLTEKVTLQLTPSQLETLQRAAERAGARFSQHSRELLVRRAGAAQVVAGARRDPEARALMNQLTAIGNNLNQLAKIANTERAAPQHRELKETTDQLKAVFSRILAL